MGRGYIYEIADDLDDIGVLDESDFYDDLGALGIDYVKNVESEEQQIIRESFAEEFKRFGATVKLVKADTPEDPEGFPDGVYVVSGINKSFKEKYFKERYEEMKRLVESITLEQFATNLSQTPLYDIKRAMFRDYDDVVSQNENGCHYGWNTLDYFIRTADPEKKYYIGRVVFMH